MQTNSLFTRNLTWLSMFVFSVIAGSGLRAQAPSDPSVEWSFAPISSVMPANLPEGEIVALGGQGAIVVQESASNRSLHVVHEKQSALLFSQGAPAPGGGTFQATAGGVYAFSKDLVYFNAHVSVGEDFPIRLFRWDAGTLSQIAVPAGVEYEIGINDKAGKFLASRRNGFTTEYWITDGVTNGAPITLTGYENRFIGGYEEKRYFVIGITSDGSFLVHEQIGSDPLGCIIADNTSKIYFLGNRNTSLADTRYMVDDCQSTIAGSDSIPHNVTSSGSVLLSFYDWPSRKQSYRFYEASGAVTTILDDSVFHLVNTSVSAYITHHPQVIFSAKTTETGNSALYTGNSASARFGGDFVSGFDQSGEVLEMDRFHESGVAVVYAKLADGSILRAFGRANSGTAPVISNGEPEDGMAHQEYSFQFTATGSPTPTFNVSAGELPEGLTLAADGLLSGIPIESGEFPITVRAANGVSPDATHEYTLVIEPRLPVIFIHGVAGSVLRSGSRTFWPSVFPQDVADLNLETGPSNAEAVDVIRQYDVGGLGAEVQQFYDPFIQYMTQQQDYVEFSLQGDRSRLTSNYLVTQEFAEKPDFFVFPYDWRKPNATHIPTLRTYIQRIRELHGGTKVNLVVHSMGGLVMRRYLLEHGSDDIEKVVTVGSPIWGAPEVAYRMLTGTFYYVGAVDFINSRTMRDAIITMPAVHELLPSTSYLENWGFPIFEELGHDFNNNGLRGEGYDTNQFRAMINAEAEPLNPALNNISFHTATQDDWSDDNSPIKYLQIVGKQAVDNTTVGVTVENKTFVTPGAFSEAKPVLQFSRVVGQGDGTVPILSSRRLPQFLAPGTVVREIDESLESFVNGEPPVGQSAEHTKLMANTAVLNLITEFFDAPPLTSPPPAESQQSLVRETSFDPEPIDTPSPGSIRVSILGASYLTVRDAQGRENTRLSEIAAQQIPGINIQYGGDEPWMNIETTSDHEWTIGNDASGEPIEIEVVEHNGAGAPISLRRYRFAPGNTPWRLIIRPDSAPDLKVDQDQDGNFTPLEAVAATHSSEGAAVDLTAPTIALELSRANGHIVASLTASDGSQPAPTIRFSRNGGAMQTYSSPLMFADGSTSDLKIFAEDAAGNTSGLIETTVNPTLSMKYNLGGTIALTWPAADGYVLEETTSFTNPWITSSTPVTRSANQNSVLLGLERPDRNFYRLRSQRIER